MTNYYSFTDKRYKIGLVKCLIDRAFRINNTWIGFHLDLTKIFDFLRKNLYPQKVLENVTKNYRDGKLSSTSNNSNPDQNGSSYFKHPYLGSFSIKSKLKLNKIVEKYCKDVKIQIVFQSEKLSSLFSVKDKLAVRSNVVYHFKCSGCNSEYVGYTIRHYHTRVHEHLVTDKGSHVNKHLKKSQVCRTQCDETCFTILDKANSKYDLKIKEAMHIQWIKPKINIQKKSQKMTIMV